MSEISTNLLTPRGSTSATIRRKGSPFAVTRVLGARADSKLIVNADGLIDSSIDDGAESRRRRFRVEWDAPLPKPAGDVYELKEKFDGVVLTVADESFDTRLFPSQSSDEPVEAEFSKDELSIEDRKLLEPGAMFVLTIGYRTSGSSRRRESCFYLRRMPAMTDEQVHLASARASRLQDELQWK